MESYTSNNAQTAIPNLPTGSFPPAQEDKMNSMAQNNMGMNPSMNSMSQEAVATTPTENSIKNMAMKVSAAVGILALVVLAIGGAITAFRFAGPAFSNLAAAIVSIGSVTQRERIDLSAPGGVTSGSPFTVEWTHVNKKVDGSYTLSYECSDGLFLKEASTDRIIFCNTPFNYQSTGSSISLEAVTAMTSDILNLSVAFTRNGEAVASETASVSIQVVDGTNTNIGIDTGTATTTPDTTNNPGTTVTTPRTPGTKTEQVTQFNSSTTTGSSTSNPNGRPDLAVRILSVGVIDRVSNQFTASSTVSLNARGGIRFEVENLGTKETGQWSFNAVLPTFPSYVYHSNSQQSLFPGDKIEFTIGFDSIAAGQNTVEAIINADPTNSIWNEASENNNIVKVPINVK